MATMTASIRSTPSLTVAPTQNTAPVFEFRCLYTRDVRKKKKTWHDGSLRFHSFNKRVMVYDDQKYFIGDLHYRESDHLNEGDELRLDKGVLVEVAEPIGQTETDLAPLLEKGRPQVVQGSSPPRAPLQSLSSATTLQSTVPYSQTRPKSLADVLGASQGRIGRAQLPSQSPFDRRQQATSTLAHADDRAAKRRKFEHEKENLQPRSEPFLPQDRHAIRRGEDATKPSHSEQHEFPRVEQGSLLEISASLFENSSAVLQARAESVGRASGQRTNVSIPTNPRNQDCALPEAVAARRQTALPVEPPVAAPKSSTSSVPRQISRTSASIAKPSFTARGQADDSSNTSRIDRRSGTEANVTSNPRPSGRLKFAPSRPRKKLMYKSLLDSPSRLTLDKDKGKSRQSTAQNVSPDQLEGPSPHNRRRATKHFQLASSSDDDLESLISRKDSRATTSDLKNTNSVSPRTPARQQSPIFLSQSTFGSPASVLQQSQDVVLSEILPLNDAHPGLSITQDKPSPRVGKMIPQQASGHGHLEHAAPPPVLSHLAEIDRRLCTPLSSLKTKRSISTPQVANKASHFRRTYSENDSNNAQQSSHAFLRQNLPPIVPKKTINTPAQLQPAIEQVSQNGRESPARLQKSISDSAVRIDTVGHEIRRTSMDSGKDEEDCGPWSTAEAFDLFATWPAAVEKPVFVAV